MIKQFRRVGIALAFGFLLGVIVTIVGPHGPRVAGMPIVIVPASEADEYLLDSAEMKRLVDEWERQWFGDDPFAQDAGGVATPVRITSGVID